MQSLKTELQSANELKADKQREISSSEESSAWKPEFKERASTNNKVPESHGTLPQVLISLIPPDQGDELSKYRRVP